MKLTIKQKKFADEYIISGNATDAAIKAGYSEKYAGANAGKSLKNTKIQKYIEDKLAELESAKTMSLEEALQRSASIARREPQKSYSKQTNRLTGEVTKEVEYVFMPSIEEAQKSLEHIIRCHGGFTDKQDIKLDVPVIFDGIDDVSD